MLVSGHNSTLGREGADALPSFDCQGTADSLGCSVSCMTHIPLAQQVSMETCNIPCHHSPPPLFLIPYTSAIYRRCKVMGTCDPRYSFLCKTCANTQTSLISLHCLSFRRLSFFPTVCVWAGAFCTSLQGDMCALYLRAALLLTIISLLRGLLFCQHSARKCSPCSLRQSDGWMGGEGTLSRLHVKILIRGLVPCCQVHTTVLLHFSSILDSCHPTQTPNIHPASGVTSSKQPVTELWALGKTTLHRKSDANLPYPSKPAPAYDL